MRDTGTRALSEVLDDLETTAHDESVSVQEIMDQLGDKSFAALMLVPALVAASPASAIPGLTATVGLIVAIMVLQMLLGRDHAWLPGFLSNRRIPTDRLCQAVRWLRRPAHFVERFLRPRLTVMVKRPGLYIPLLVVLAITLVMPFLEVIPTSGSIASIAIAFFAAGLLTHDGLLVLIGLLFVLGLPFAIWQFAGG
jgi:hypothetical protein